MVDKSVLGAFLGGGPLLHVRDEKTSGTAGGGSSSGDNDRDLNTILTDEIGITGVTSPKIEGVPAGVFEIMARAPNFAGKRNRIRLVKVSDGSDLVLGAATHCDANGAVSDHAPLFGRFSLSSSDDLKIVHYIESSSASNGLGVETNDGNIEVYTEAMIRQVG